MTTFEEFLRRQIIAWFSSESAAYAVLGDLDSRVQHIARNWEQVQQVGQLIEDDIRLFYEGDKEKVVIGDVYLQDASHSPWARGEWEVIAIDRFPTGLRFPRVTRRNIKTGRIDVNGWNNSNKRLVTRAESDGMAGVDTYQECFCGDARGDHAYDHDMLSLECRKCSTCFEFQFKRWSPAPPSGSTPGEVAQ